jgi:ribonuclease P protein component
MSAGSVPRRTLGRTARLKQGRDFLRLKQTGHRAVQRCLIVNWQTAPPGHPARVGVVVSRKIGNAVQRSRARRLLRESFRRHRPNDSAAGRELVARPALRKTVGGRGKGLFDSPAPAACCPPRRQKNDGAGGWPMVGRWRRHLENTR